VSSKNALLLLGSTGFLGRAVVDLLYFEPNKHLDIFVAKSPASTNSIPVNLLTSGYKVGFEFELSKLMQSNYSNLAIINCASSRNSNNEELAREGNFEYPCRVLEQLLGASDINVEWIQIETYWQYTKSPIPDKSYVFWKNQFSVFLDEYPQRERLRIKRLTLPHLIGPNDDPRRFLPKLLSNLIHGNSTVVNADGDIFYLADVRDVAKVLVPNSFGQINRLIDHKQLFPFYDLTLREIIDKFSLTANCGSKIELKDASNKSNPTLNLSEQPQLLGSAHQLLRSLDETFSDIAKWLSTLQQLGNLR
jgi:nucleoside-diphosphate-sugar epimerase